MIDIEVTIEELEPIIAPMTTFEQPELPPVCL
jgi:hypothetical protein